MNTTRLLIAEYAIAVGFTSWYSMKAGYWPWPGTIVKISGAFAVFGVAAIFMPQVAPILAGGFMLAGFLTLYQKGLSNYNGGLPSSGVTGELLTWGNGPQQGAPTNQTG